MKKHFLNAAVLVFLSLGACAYGAQAHPASAELKQKIELTVEYLVNYAPESKVDRVQAHLQKLLEKLEPVALSDLDWLRFVTVYAANLAHTEDQVGPALERITVDCGSGHSAEAQAELIDLQAEIQSSKVHNRAQTVVNTLLGALQKSCN